VALSCNKHIVFLTDGNPLDGAVRLAAMQEAVKTMASNGITLSVIGIGSEVVGNQNAIKILQEMAQNGGTGVPPLLIAILTDASDPKLKDFMRDCVEALKGRLKSDAVSP